jgi:hypothetical protein
MDITPSSWGFMIGMSSIISKDVVITPLSHMFGGCISGFFCSMGANIIDGCLPHPHFRIVFPMLTTITVCYRLSQLKRKKQITYDPYTSPSPRKSYDRSPSPPPYKESK